MAREDIEASEVGKKIIQKTGYDPVDLLKAPVEPPAPRSSSLPGGNQILGIAVGAGLVVAGIIAWLALGSALLLLIAVLGAVCIVAATLIQPRT